MDDCLPDCPVPIGASKAVWIIGLSIIGLALFCACCSAIMKGARRRRYDRIDDEIDREEREANRQEREERRQRNRVVSGQVYESFIENANDANNVDSGIPNVTVGEPGDLKHASTLGFDPNGSQIDSGLLAEAVNVNGSSLIRDGGAYASPVVYASSSGNDNAYDDIGDQIIRADSVGDKECG